MFLNISELRRSVRRTAAAAADAVAGETVYRHYDSRVAEMH